MNYQLIRTNIFPSSISEALVETSDELSELDVQLNETLETIKNLTPNCDKYDYILSASSGTLCGILDVLMMIQKHLLTYI